MNVREIERAARFAWPAMEEQELSYGVLRHASSPDRRTNALCLYPVVDLVPMELIQVAEEYFRARDAAPVVRIVCSETSSLSALAEVDRELDNRGYEKQSPTQTMLLDLANAPAIQKFREDEPESVPDLSSWLCAWYAFRGTPLESIAGHREVLAQLEPTNLLLLSRCVAGLPVSTGMGVLSAGTVGLFGIATAIDHRQLGYASDIVISLLSWASQREARFAYLQVEESNEAAIKLYGKLGFRKFYSYWYRVGKQAVGSGGSQIEHV